MDISNDGHNSSKSSDNDSSDNDVVSNSTDNKISEDITLILRSFYRYMTDPDRERKPSSVAEVVRDIRKIIILIDANKDLNMLFDEDSKNVREKYLSGYCLTTKMQPSSIRKYLYSLIDFTKYVLKSSFVDRFCKDNIKNLKNNIKL